MPNKQCFGAAFRIKTKLYIVGGMNGDKGMMVAAEWVQTTLVFDLISETWSKGPKVPYILQFPKAFVTSTEQYAFIYGDMGEEDGKMYGRNGDKERVLLSFNEEEGFRRVEDINNFPLKY